jgi:hypothetical protein
MGEHHCFSFKWHEACPSDRSATRGCLVARSHGVSAAEPRRHCRQRVACRFARVEPLAVASGSARRILILHPA